MSYFILPFLLLLFKCKFYRTNGRASLSAIDYSKFCDFCSKESPLSFYS